MSVINIPERIPPRIAMVVRKGGRNQWLVFDCPCWTGHRVLLNLDPSKPSGMDNDANRHSVARPKRRPTYNQPALPLHDQERARDMGLTADEPDLERSATTPPSIFTRSCDRTARTPGDTHFSRSRGVVRARRHNNKSPTHAPVRSNQLRAILPTTTHPRHRGTDRDQSDLLCRRSERLHRPSRHDRYGRSAPNVPIGSAIDVLLNSPGGDIDAAEKLVNLVRRRAGTSRVRVIVPDYAKSAATLITLGADQIVMSDSSELGAIDPQVTLVNGQNNPSTYSASSYIDAYSEHARALKVDPHDPVARLMLDKLDPVTLRKMQRTVKRSTEIAVELLRQAMIKGEDVAQDAANQLSDTERWRSHGQVIGHG